MHFDHAIVPFEDQRELLVLMGYAQQIKCAHLTEDDQIANGRVKSRDEVPAGAVEVLFQLNQDLFSIITLTEALNHRSQLSLVVIEPLVDHLSLGKTPFRELIELRIRIHVVSLARVDITELLQCLYWLIDHCFTNLQPKRTLS